MTTIMYKATPPTTFPIKKANYRLTNNCKCNILTAIVCITEE